MAAIPRSLRSVRAATEPDWLQKFSERADVAWQLWGKDTYEKDQAARNPPPPPQPEPVPSMPDPEQQQKMARRSQAALRSRRGRASTIFTSPDVGQGLGG